MEQRKFVKSQIHIGKNLSQCPLTLESQDFLRLVFQIKPYEHRCGTLQDVWIKFLTTYKELKYLTEGIWQSQPKSNRGGGSSRIFTAGLTRGIVHQPHGISMNYVGDPLLKRIRLIFERFNWTPEKFNILRE
jgi:hypothetical protein